MGVMGTGRNLKRKKLVGKEHEYNRELRIFSPNSLGFYA